MSDQIADGHINLPHLNPGDYIKIMINDTSSSEMTFQTWQILSEQDLVDHIAKLDDKDQAFYTMRHNFVAMTNGQGFTQIFQKFLVDRMFVNKVEKPDDWV